MNREHYYVKAMSKMEQDKRMGKDWHTTYVYNCNIIDRLDKIQKELGLLGIVVTIESLLKQYKLTLILD